MLVFAEMLRKSCSLVMVLSLLAVGCSSTGLKQRAASPRRGGAFKLIVQSPPETLDPHRIVFLPDYEMASLIYEGLTAQGSHESEIRPALAERWEALEGGRRWIFHLRANACFQDDPCFRGGRGRTLSSRDVVYSFERMASAKTDCANWYLFSGKVEGIDDFHAGRASSIRGVKALDDRRVEILLTKPYAAFLKILSTQAAMILPREAVEYYGEEFSNHPVGTGPFRLVRRKPLEQYLLGRNARYWRTDAQGGQLPYLDAIDVSIRSDANEAGQLAALLKGDAYLFKAQQKLYDTLRNDPAPAGKFQLVGEAPPISLRFLGFALDTATPLARYAELRRAVAMAFDREGLVRQSPQVIPILAGTLVPSAFLKKVRGGHPYDPDAAKTIFARYRRELEASPPTLGVNFQSDDLNLLRRNLTQAAVKTILQVRPLNYYEYIVKERPSIFRVSFTPSIFDAEDYYCLFYSKSSREVNLTGYRNPEYDSVLESAMAEMNPGKRSELFLRLEEILSLDVPAIYLNHGTPTYLLAAPRVRGMALRFILPDFTEAWLAETNAQRPQGQPSK
jgi:oligopeptide transport system substrate-binding protein